MERTFPALDISWPHAPSDERVELLLADLDEHAPIAVETHERGVRVFFSSPLRRRDAATQLAATVPDASCAAIDVPDERWAERSQASLGAVSVGRFVVAPPWDATPLDGERVVIQPSMGFGTAHHASTRVCLRLLQDLPVRGATVLDAGTGSGVLAIVAAKMGAARVVALDDDPDAIASARENVSLNGVETAVAVFCQALDTAAAAHGSFDAVLANLTAAVLDRHARDLAGCTRHDGLLITSGYGPEEAAAVAAALARTGFVPDGRIEEAGWVGARFRRALPSPDRP